MEGGRPMRSFPLIVWYRSKALARLQLFTGITEGVREGPMLASILLGRDSEESMVLSHVGSLPSPWPHRLTRLGRWGSSFCPSPSRPLSTPARRAKTCSLPGSSYPSPVKETDPLICPAGWCIVWRFQIGAFSGTMLAVVWRLVFRVELPEAQAGAQLR